MNSSSSSTYPQPFLDKLATVKNKRARVVIDHILKHGSITTEELKNQYGYNHPPRAAKDVRDEGIPLETIAVKGQDGRSIAAYRFGNPSLILSDREGGRKSLPKKLKQQLFHAQNDRCAICNAKFALRELQIDHRIPYEIGGDPDAPENPSHLYMLVCGSCNRAKSWSCEHCPNWLQRDQTVCQSCYWANPHDYKHVASRQIRRIDILWEENEVAFHEQIRQSAISKQISIQEYIKNLLHSIAFLA